MPVSRPLGPHIGWGQYDGLVLISASTGTSFSTSILESIVSRNQPGRTAQIHLLVIAKHAAHIGSYRPRISRALVDASGAEIVVNAHTTVTGAFGALQEIRTDMEQDGPIPGAKWEAEDVGNKDMIDDVESTRSTSDVCVTDDLEFGYSTRSLHASPGRPDLAAFINAALSVMAGRSAVSVCGGPDPITGVGNALARTSLQRCSAGGEVRIEDVDFYIGGFKE